MTSATRARHRRGRRPAVEEHVRTAATAWLLLAACLGVGALAPVLAGWRPVVVVSGSMAPRIDAGDVVVVAPAPGPLRRGQVVLVRDPEQPTGTRLHRVVAVRSDGAVVTRGDANSSDDVRPVPPGDVLGIGRLLVPHAGVPALLRASPGPRDLAWIGSLLAAALVVVAPQRGTAPATPGRRPERGRGRRRSLFPSTRGNQSDARTLIEISPAAHGR